MFRRAVILPTGPESVWRAITEPGAVEGWFGATVEWDLRPGGRARFRHLVDGGDRDGVIDDVEPGRTLRFRWWPAGSDDDVSEIAYELEAHDDGTTLTVTERQVEAAPPAVRAFAGPAVLSAWSAADQASWESWAGSEPGSRSARGGLLRPLSLSVPPPTSPVGPGGRRRPAPGRGRTPSSRLSGTRRRRQLLDRLARDGPLTATQLAPAYPMSRQAW